MKTRKEEVAVLKDCLQLYRDYLEKQDWNSIKHLAEVIRDSARFLELEDKLDFTNFELELKKINPTIK